MTALMPQAKQQYFSNAGAPLVGGKVYTYAAGTTTPLATYTDASGSTPNTNPVILDARGEASIFFGTASYKIVLKDASDVTIWTQDNLAGDAAGAALAALAASGGSALVGYLPAGTGAVPTTVQAKLRESVSVKDFGAVAGGSAGVNNAAFAAAITYCASVGKTLYVPSGTYSLSAELSTSGDLHIEGDGDSTVLDFSGTVTSASGYALRAYGSLSALPSLASSASKNALALSFASAPSLTSNGVFVIYNPTDYSYSGFRSYYRAGEWCECNGVSGSTATVNNPLYDGYVAAAVNLYKLSGPSVSLRNFRIKGTTVTGLICLTLCNRPLIENVSGYLESNSVVSFDRCYRPTAANLNLFNKGTGTGDDYGLVVTNSQHVQVIGGNYYSRRHAITTGGGADVGCVPCRDLRFTSLTTKNDINSGVWSADFHGNTEDCVYENCRIYNGASWQGKNNRYVNCVISDILTYQCIYSAEIKGGYFTLENCTLISSGDPSANNRGIIDLGGNSVVVSANTVEPTTFVVKDCRLIAPNASAVTSLVIFKNQGCVQNVNFDIDGVTALSVTSFGQILYTDRLTGTAASQFIVVDRITGFPSGTYLHNPAGNNYANFPHRCQRQTGSASITATSGTNNTIAGFTSFKYPYPRTPAALVSTAGSFTVFNGNKPILPNIFALSNTQIRPVVSTGDAVNWTSTNSVTFNWMALIDDV